MLSEGKNDTCASQEDSEKGNQQQGHPDESEHCWVSRMQTKEETKKKTMKTTIQPSFGVKKEKPSCQGTPPPLSNLVVGT